MLPRLRARPTCALFLLCLVQGCERFAFIAMLPLFILYLHQRHGLSEHEALLLLAVFQALSYLVSLPAGHLLDRCIGPGPAALLGCMLLALGYGALALDWPVLLWPALGVMIVGHSFFKPGLSSIASGLLGATRREQVFLWLHLATNIGGMMGLLFAERARIRDGWRGVFMWATAAMALGALLFALRPRNASAVPNAEGRRPSTYRSAVFAREQVQAIWLICGIALVFWLTAQQASTSLTLFAEAHTRRHLTFGAWQLALGPGHFASLHSLLVLLLLPLSLWTSQRLRRRDVAPSIPVKMVWGYVATAGAFAVMGAACLRGGDVGRVHVAWLAGCYILLSIAEVQLAPLGLALITQLAPPRKMSCALGLWFASVAFGNGLTGIFGLLWGRWPTHRYFALLALLSIGAALVLWMRLRHLEALLRRTALPFEKANPL